MKKFLVVQEEKCTTCNADVELIRECPNCDGYGVVREEIALEDALRELGIYVETISLSDALTELGIIF